MSDLHEYSGDTRSRFFVFMGVCGVGKSTIARSVAEALAGSFVESDVLHSPESVKAMSKGRPLTDEERWPWLEAVCDAALACDPERSVMIACSALARRHRDLIRTRLPDVVFLHLQGSVDLVRARMSLRKSHFMSPAMLESQLCVLEPPEHEPDSHKLDVDEPRDALIAQAISICRRHIAATPQGAQQGADRKQDRTGKASRRKNHA